MSESDFELRHQTYSYSFGTVSCIMYASWLFRMQMLVAEWTVSRCSLFCKRIQLKVQ